MFRWDLTEFPEPGAQQVLTVERGQSASLEQAWQEIEKEGAEWTANALSEGRKRFADLIQALSADEALDAGEIEREALAGSGVYGEWRREAGEEPPESITAEDFARYQWDYADDMDPNRERRYSITTETALVGIVEPD